jgi:hypothetical protein
MNGKKSPAAFAARVSPWQNPEDFLQQNLSAARAGIEGKVNEATTYTRENPEKALMWALGGGYLLRMLPITGIFAALIRVLLALLKPAAAIYGIAKIWQKAQPLVQQRPSTSPPQQSTPRPQPR